MHHLNAFQKLVEWAISLLCAVGAAGLLIQHQSLEAFVLFALGLAVTPLMRANNFIKAGLTVLGFVVVFWR